MATSNTPTQQPDWHIPAGTPVPKLYINNSLTRKKNVFSFDIVRRIMTDYFGYDLQYVMNITDIDDKIIVSARQKHLFSKYCADHPTLDADVIAKAEAGWRFFVTKHLDKHLVNAADNWDEFMAKNSAGTLSNVSDNPKFDLYRKAAVISRTSIEMAKAGSISISEFYAALRDPLSLLIDSEEGGNTTDQQIFRDYAAYWEADFFEDMDALNIRRPDVLTRVSEYVPEIIAFSDKHTYAKIEPWSAGNVKLFQEGEGDLTVEANGKRNSSDFALWKCSKPGEPSWESPWGKGRPGWHIECSAMAGNVLGEKIDIHSGGIDLTFPHHDNELAQSESHYGCTQWVNYFVHTGHLHIEGQKMSKSLKNFISIKEALESNTNSQIRLMYLMHQWDSTLDWSAGSLSEARTIETSINNFLSLVKALVQEDKFTGRVISESHNYGQVEKDLMELHLQKQSDVYAALADSFNTPVAMGELRQLISAANQYYHAKTKAKALVNIPLLSSIASYVTKLMRTFGVFVDANPAIGAPSRGTAQNSEESVMPYLRVLSLFRDSVRELAQNKAGNVQDVHSDRFGDQALVKLVDRDTLIQQRKETLQKEQERLHEKESRLKAAALKRAERLEKGRVPPGMLFKTAEFSSWDDQGIPTLDKDGVEVAKSRRKRLEKEFAAQVKLHNEFLAETATKTD
ncbi:hypothetical protein BSLG_006840 [Batrachochytrium salamandrivorans]|nr:hypothetical protein BSLG_006840 [Batrachochytrium salamandrivorans]